MKRKLKKFFTVFSVFICLVSVNLSLFTIAASANSVSNFNYSYRTLGAPIGIRYYSKNFSGDSYPFTPGVINRPNVYYYDLNTNNAPTWVEGVGGDTDFSISYSGIANSVADIFLDFEKYTAFEEVFIDSPIIFSDFEDLDDFYNIIFGFSDPHSATSEDLNSTIPITYFYTFLTLDLVDGSLEISFEEVEQTVSFNYNNNYFYVPLFSDEVLTRDLLLRYNSFVGSNGVKYCFLLEGGFRSAVFCDYYFMETRDSLNNWSLEYYNEVFDDRLGFVYNALSYQETIVFEDVSWTDWIVNSVGSFLDFQIIPGLSFAGMLGLLVGMSLFVVFLKIFAGG